MYTTSETQIYQASALNNNGTHKYAFQRVNKNSDGTTTIITIQNRGDDIYNVFQITRNKEGIVKKRIYQIGKEYISSLMKANKDDLANNLIKIISNKKNNTSVKKTSPKKTSVKKTSAKKTPAKKTSVKKTSAKKTSTKKTPVKKTSTKKTSPKKTSTKKTSARKTPVKKTSVKKTSAKK